ncbi:MAG: hypothetical protein EAZ42_03850, partial [Verrucomicrobia bacterium]
MLLGGVPLLHAEPFDQTERQLFHLSPIGAWDDSSFAANDVGYYKSRMLRLNGGVEPAHLKVGVSTGLDFLTSTFGEDFDYIYAPGKVQQFSEHRIGEIDFSLDVARKTNTRFGFHVNGMPWGDTPNQAEDHLHNFLEKFQNGAMLQVDRSGRIRRQSNPQNPFIDETFESAPQLEMQLSLSRNALLVRNYVSRNTRSAMRQLWALREQHPDLISFASMSSEVGMNVHANVDFCDYSQWSQQEFREWLSGTGGYQGNGQFLTILDFNTAFAGATGFPFRDWQAVTPPRDPVFSITTPNGRWWQLWHRFRTHQVQQMVQAQIGWCRDVGWSPDMLYSHQIPNNPASTSTLDLMHATPWDTAFVTGGGTGITTYGPKARDTTIFSAMRQNDKNWGIFEYNPLSTNFSNNLQALNAVWNSEAKALAPFLWWGFPEYQIRGTSFEQALTQFVFDRRNDRFSSLAAHQVSPTSNDVIWPMNNIDEVESHTFSVSPTVSNGMLRGGLSNPAGKLSLLFNESATRAIHGDSFHAISFRLKLDGQEAQNAEVAWTLKNGQRHQVSLEIKPGWQIYQIHMSHLPKWAGQSIHGIDLTPSNKTVGAFELDWFRIEANPAWHFQDLAEVHSVQNIVGGQILNGRLIGTTGESAHFYLSTDRSNPTLDADRAAIDSQRFNQLCMVMDSSMDGHAALSWRVRDVPSSEWPRHIFPIRSGTHRYQINLAGHADWRGEITRLKLEPLTTAGGQIAIDSLTFAPKMLCPRMIMTDTIVHSNHPLFRWVKAVEPGRGLMTTTFELARDFEFNEIVSREAGLVRDDWVYTRAAELDGHYWWRVRAETTDGVVSPWAKPMPIFIRPWRFNDLNEVVYAFGYIGPTIRNGVWSGRTRNENNNWIGLNTGRGLSRGIDTAVAKRLKIRVALNGEIPNNTGLLFCTMDHGGTIFKSISIPANGEWQDVVIDLSGEPNWYGRAKEIWIHPTSSAAMNVFLDEIELLPAVLNNPNQAPSFVIGPNIQVPKNSEAAFYASWASFINPGPNESSQEMHFVLECDRPELFSQLPSITREGNLSFIPASNQVGSARLRVTLLDDGGLLDGGVNQSEPQFFNIRILPPNTPPVANDDALSAHSRVTSQFAAAVLLANDTDVDGQNLSITSVSQTSLAGAEVSFSNEVVQYRPPLAFVGNDSFQYHVSNGQGGVDQAEVRVRVIEPRIVDFFRNENGAFKLSLSGLPGHRYWIESSPNLLDWTMRL